MNEKPTITIRHNPDGSIVEVLPDGTTRPAVDRTDYARLAAMTEQEIEENAAGDRDDPPLAEEELARIRPVPDVRAIRGRLGLTQQRFAELFHIPLGTIRDWERGARYPDASARILLTVIDRAPATVIEALGDPEGQAWITGRKPVHSRQ